MNRTRCKPRLRPPAPLGACYGNSQGHQARREIHEKEERARQSRVDNEQIFQTIIAQSFDYDTVLLRCEAMAEFFETLRGYGGRDIRAWLSTYRRTPDERCWTQRVQWIGERLNEEMFAGQWRHDFESHWRQWKAGMRYRAALADAQNQGVKGGDPDA